MSKKRRNMIIIGMILLIALCIVPYVFMGTGSPFDEGGSFEFLAENEWLNNALGGEISLDELQTDCDILSDDTFDVTDDCSIDIDGEDEELNFDTPRDLRLTMCWGSVVVNMNHEAEKIEVEDAIIPTERNTNTLTLNIFKEGDSEIEINCESDSCRMAINDVECPAQSEISRSNIDTSSNCSINSDNQIFFRQSCVLTIDTTDSEDEDGDSNPIFFDAEDRPRAVSVDYCLGDIAFRASSDEDNFEFYDTAAMPDDGRHREVDIYGEDITEIIMLCLMPPQASPTPRDFTGTASGSPQCMVVISNSGCFP